MVITRRWWLSEPKSKRWREGVTRWLILKTYAKVIIRWPYTFTRCWFRSWHISVRFQEVDRSGYQCGGSWSGVYEGRRQELIDKYTEDWHPPFGANLLSSGKYYLDVKARRCWPWELF